MSHEGKRARAIAKAAGATTLWTILAPLSLVRWFGSRLYLPYNRGTLGAARWNEQKKLQAAAIDRMSSACVTTGALGPVIASVISTASTPGGNPQSATITLASIEAVLLGIPKIGLSLWFLAGILLHMYARHVLSQMMDAVK